MPKYSLIPAKNTVDALAETDKIAVLVNKGSTEAPILEVQLWPMVDFTKRNHARVQYTDPYVSYGPHPPEYYFWNNAYPNGNVYITLDKNTEENDCSHVFCQGGRAQWEVGSTTELAGAANNYRIKVVRNPTADAANDQFVDLFVAEYTAETCWFVTKLGVGIAPVDKFHVFEGENAAGRLIATLEHFNGTGAGSQSAVLQYKGIGSAWVTGNDYGLNGGDNWFVSKSSGALKVLVTNEGAEITGSLTINGLGNFGQGRIYGNASLGMVIAPITGTAYDFLLTDTAGNSALSMTTATKNFVFWGAVGFNGSAALAKPTLAAAATDLASAITLVNSIRSAMINYGLAS